MSQFTSSRQITRRDVLLLALIIALAFAYRVVIIADRAAAPDNAGAFDPLPEGSDQLTYYRTIFDHRAGTYPPPAFFYQPGISYFFIGLTGLLGTTDLLAMRLALAALASVNCALMFGVAQLAFGRPPISLIAAALYAIYPVGAFYDTDLVIASQATMLLTLALLGALWLYRSPRCWPGAVIVGAVVGIGAITRLEIAAAAGTLVLWLFIVRWRRHSLVPLALAGLAALAFIGPVALHNRQGGADYLITPVGPTEVYRGFSRDAGGTYFVSRADFTTRTDFFHYLLLDMRLESVRFAELVLRKTGLFLSAAEPGNNLDYHVSGEAVSPALRLNPLDFRVLLVLAVFGMAALWRSDRPALLAFLSVCAAMFVMTMLIWIEARIRLPIIAALIPCAAYGIYDIAAHARRAAFWRRRALLIAALVIGLGLAWLAEMHLPRKVTAAALPPDARPVNALYNDELRLVGYRIEDSYSPAGSFQPFRPYVVTLFWKLERPTTIDYSFALKFVVNGEALEQFDHPIGYVSYPQRATSAWEADGRIYVEHVGMSVRAFDVPLEISGYLWLEVYPERDITQILEPVGAGAPPLELARPAVIWRSDSFTTPALLAAEGAQDDLTFGDLLVLKGWDMPSAGGRGESVTVTMGWETTQTPIRDSYIIGVYLQDEAGEFVANFDSPPRDGRLLTNSLPPAHHFEDPRVIALPQQPGIYTVYTAVYRQDNSERLPLPAPGETLARLGTIAVQ